MSVKKRGLGRGLDALLSNSRPAASQSEQASPAAASEDIDANLDGELKQLPVEWLQPGKYQPRKDMSADALDELANSIKVQGIIQPIVVRMLAKQKYEIIAGERRWRAAQLAELHEIPCLIKEVADEAAVAIALIENIQREDLNAMEEAVALDRLMNEFELTHQQVADAVGKSRTTVTNILRLNGLNDDVKRLLEYGDIEMGHARAVLALEGEAQSEAARTVAAKGLTVRETESLVKRMLQPKAAPKNKTPDPDVAKMETQLSERLGAKVAISHNAKGKGKLVISYSSLDEFEGIVEKFQ